MSGITRRDLFSRMSTAIASADLVLVLGTSLSGLNADQVLIMNENHEVMFYHFEF